MAKILYCSGGGENPFASNIGLAYGLRRAGHDVVWVGPAYNGMCNADIEIEDREHPELYTYTEVLSLVAPWKPDFILVVEPHFFLHGDKPEGIKSVYYILDPHRGYTLHKYAIKVGNYDKVITTDSKYAVGDIYGVSGDSFYILRQAVDPRRFTTYRSVSEVKCTISFVGQTGIANMEYPYEDECGRYATHPPKSLPSGIERYEFHKDGILDYAERAELLIRLCSMFNVRMYTGVYGEGFERAIQNGLIGFNRSLNGDLGMRPYEVLAAGRMLVSDRRPYLYKPDVDTYEAYSTFNIKPFLPNFEVEFNSVVFAIKRLLLKRASMEPEHLDKQLMIASAEVLECHSWAERGHILGLMVPNE